MKEDNYILPQKSAMRKLKISEIGAEAPDLKNISESKAIAIAKWMIKWIEAEISSGVPLTGVLLPSKSDMAYFLGVSIGTIQNALRYIEDLGYVESKQCIGTIIKSGKASGTSNMRKLTSKREIAVSAIKKYILEQNFSAGKYLPSSRKIAEIIGCSANTTRLALEYLCTEGIIEHRFKNSRDAGWLLKNTNFAFNTGDVPEQETLVSKVEDDLKKYITANLKTGDKIPAHAKLSQLLKVSIKTIHDALKVLVDEGILLPRRGRYGTIVIKLPDEAASCIKKETSIFAPAQQTAFYYYEKTQNYIKRMISENYEIGAKLPSIMELSKEMDLSPNTIRKAFQNLAKEGYLAFSRGRYGGTFVIDIPETEEAAFKWLAVNPQYAEVYNN